MISPIEESYLTSPFTFNATNPLKWIHTVVPPPVQNPESVSQVGSSTVDIIFNLFAQRNISDEEQHSLQTWNLLKHLIDLAQGLPNAVEAIKEAGIAWNSLMNSVNESSYDKGGKEKQCPYFLSKMNASLVDDSGYKLRLPCGLTQGSSITIIGIPRGLLGNFRIDFTADPLPGEPEPPIILHYNVRLNGDKLTEDPVIVQNTWTIAHDWGEEERCPSSDLNKNKKGQYIFRFFIIFDLVHCGVGSVLLEEEIFWFLPYFLKPSLFNFTRGYQGNIIKTSTNWGTYVHFLPLFPNL